MVLAEAGIAGTKLEELEEEEVGLKETGDGDPEKVKPNDIEPEGVAVVVDVADVVLVVLGETALGVALADTGLAEAVALASVDALEGRALTELAAAVLEALVPEEETEGLLLAREGMTKTELFADLLAVTGEALTDWADGDAVADTFWVGANWNEVKTNLLCKESAMTKRSVAPVWPGTKVAA